MYVRKLLLKMAENIICKPKTINKSIGTKKTFETNNKKALASDWHTVGNDIRNVLFDDTEKGKKNT